VGLAVTVDDGVALEVEVSVQDGVAVSEAVTVSVLVIESVTVALALSVGDQVMLGVALELGTAVGVCEAETVLLGVGEEISGVCEGVKVGVKVRVGNTNVLRGVGILKKGLSGSFGFIRPDGPFNQNGKAWPKPGKANKKHKNTKRNFTMWHSRARLCDFRSLGTLKVYESSSVQASLFIPSL
jgi:hypothetical protein